MRVHRSIGIILLCGLLALSSALGASKKKPEPPPHQGPTIASVTATSITVAEASSTKTFGITQFTEIIVNGQKATAAQLKPGMKVSVVISTDSSKASRITATAK